jgi:hypothetical protein
MMRLDLVSNKLTHDLCVNELIGTKLLCTCVCVLDGWMGQHKQTKKLDGAAAILLGE